MFVFFSLAKAHTHTHTHTHTYTHTHIHTNIHTHTHTHTHTQTHTQAHKHTHKHTHAHAHTHTHIHTSMHRHTCTYTYTLAVAAAWIWMHNTNMHPLTLPVPFLGGESILDLHTKCGNKKEFFMGSWFVNTAFHDAYGSASTASTGGAGRRVSCRSASVLRRQYILFSRGILSAVFLRFAQELLRTAGRSCLI